MQKKESFGQFWKSEWDKRCPPRVRKWLFAAGAAAGVVIIWWLNSGADFARWDGKL